MDRFTMYFFRRLLFPVCFLAALLIFGSVDAFGQDIAGKTIAGYQGWFAAQGDGSPVGELSSGRGNSHLNLETYPDMREFPDSERFPAPENWGAMSNGSTATIFGSDRDFTVNRHVEWMRQYGIDCAAIQRFGEVARDSVYREQKDQVTTKLMKACEHNGVKFYIEYDTSGSGNNGWGPDWVTSIENDWSSFAVAKNIVHSAAYAHENGRPVIELWGMGLNGNGISQNQQEWIDLIDWFKSQGCYVIGGVPTGWLGESSFGDAVANFANVYPLCNAISPWVVGRFRGTAGADSYAKTNEGPELAWCKARSILYLPCVYPGTSFFNTDGKTKNIIPREHGLLLWEQLANLRNLGIRSCFVSMFDEYNEATAIAKSAEDSSQVPESKWFLCFDADGTSLSSDYYLRLVQDGSAMIKGSAPLSWSIPTQPWNDIFAAKSRPIQYHSVQAGDSKSVQLTKVINETGDLSKRVTRYSRLYFDIDPDQDSGRCASIEIIFNDGSKLSTRSCVDQNGYGLRVDDAHGGAIALKRWTTITSCIGRFAGKKIKQVYVASSSGQVSSSGVIENIEISD